MLKKYFSFIISAAILIFGMTAIYSCSPTASGGAANTTPTAYKYVFGTSIGYNGNLGGLSGADTKCATHASSAGLTGSWKAWLSDEATNAIDRIAEVGPWYLVGTTTIVAQTKASFALTPSGEINRNENGQLMGSVFYWTGTSSGGAKTAGNTCTSWSVTTGFGSIHQQNTTTPASAWTPGGVTNCTAPSILLACIQQ